MKWTPKFVTPHTLNHYFLLNHNKLKAIRTKLKGTPHIKLSGVRCGDYPGKQYYWYDIEYIIDVLGFKPIKAIPDRLIKAQA